MRCPACGATSIARSHRQGFVENVVLTSLSVYPFRCRACKARFVRRHTRLERDADNAAPERPVWLTASVWIAILLVVACAVVALVVTFAE